jgi:hypothetical protein
MTFDKLRILIVAAAVLFCLIGETKQFPAYALVAISSRLYKSDSD